MSLDIENSHCAAPLSLSCTVQAVKITVINELSLVLIRATRYCNRIA
jgi:hypothetical protein